MDAMGTCADQHKVSAEGTGSVRKMAHGANGLKIVLWGTAGLTTYTALELLESRGELAGVVEGRSSGQERYYSGILGRARAKVFRYSSYQKAHRAGLPAIIYHSSRRVQAEQFLRAIKPDVCVVASFPFLIPESLLSLVPLGFINVHLSLLPAFRGPAPTLWECATFSRTAGVTIHQLDAGEDTGDILRQEGFEVEPGMDSKAFYAKHLEIARRILGQTLDDLKAGTVQRTVQSHLSCAMRARRVKPDEDIVDWTNWPIARVHHLLRTGRMWYTPPQLSSGWYRFFDWEVVGYELCTPTRPPGSLGWHHLKVYLAHPEGKIYLRGKLSLRKSLWPLLLKPGR